MAIEKSSSNRSSSTSPTSSERRVSTPSVEPKRVAAPPPPPPKPLTPMKFQDGMDAPKPPAKVELAGPTGTIETVATTGIDKSTETTTRNGSLASLTPETTTENGNKAVGSVALGSGTATTKVSAELTEASASAVAEASVLEFKGTVTSADEKRELSGELKVGTVEAGIASELKVGDNGPSAGVTVNGGATAVSAEISSTEKTDDGSITYGAEVKAASIEYEASVTGTASTEKLEVEVKVKVDATLIEASGSRKQAVDFEIAGQKYQAEIDLSATGKIGVNGELSLKITLDASGPKVEIEGEGFAGVNASLNAGIKVTHEGDTIADVKAEVALGVGVGGSFGKEASPDGVELKDGMLEFKFDGDVQIGAANISAKIEGKVDLEEVGEAGMDTLRDNVLSMFGDTGPSTPEESQQWLEDWAAAQPIAA